jgi:alginate O-acetyltransferase complex protein AlgI
MGWLSSNDWFMSLALPLGISFYTFQQIGYLVDCFSNKVKDNNFINYSSFVTFFPQLIAGPIVHHKELTTQFNKLNVNSINAELVGMGCILFIFGLFKKIVIADNLGPYANVVFDNYDALGLIDAWTGALAYTLQLYYDFSGYCEMAMGLGLFFGIKLPINFFSPYKSKNISVFWRNWHITLGAFFKQYIYIPLGGNRSSMTVNLMVLFIVAFISGIWHGAGLTFVIWGCLHGMALMVHKMWERVGINVGAVIGTMLTFLFVLLAWVPFRSNSVEASFSIWEAMLNFENLGIPKLVENINENTQSALFFGYELLICLGLLISIFFYKNVHEIIKQPTKLNAIKYVCLLALTLGCLGQSNEFLYFDF